MPIPTVSQESKFIRVIINLLIIIIGISIITGLLSIRSWYKPSIKLGEVSPVTQVLKKDVTVVDRLKTDEAKKKAKRDAIQNISNRRILQVDNDKVQQSFENLKFLIKVIRDELNPQQMPVFPINNKVSMDIQQELIDLGEEEFKEFEVLAENNTSEEISVSIDVNKYSKYLSGVNILSEIEKKFFMEELVKIRKETQRIKKEKDTLGRSAFENLKKVNAEALFVKTFEVQKKLLDLGIVNGIPNDKISENIHILYPELGFFERSLIQKMVSQTTLPNINIDWHEVNKVEREAMSKVPKIEVELKAGTVLAKKGEKLEENNYYYLKELNMLSAEPDWNQLSRNMIAVSLCVLILTIFLFLLKIKKCNTSELLMIFFVTIGTLALIDLISVWGVNKLAMAPLPIIAILLTAFYMPGMAATVTVLTSFFLTYSMDMNFWQVVPLFAGSMYAIFLVRRAHQREDLTNAGTKIAITQVLVFAFTVLLAVGDFEVMTVLAIASLYVLSGVVSGIVSVAALPYLESSLRLLTPFKLAELSNPNQPLLKKLKEKAPGTYDHSLNVSRFAEEAAQAIGANTELLRVGLLYHDIGKTYKPDYFIENQFGAPNPHTTLDDPRQSAQIIIKHVPEGIRLAKQYSLPQKIIDFIPMHQGETITNYFYAKAIEKNGKESVNPEDYRYPGPSPNSKETGIAMMADSIEASLKSVKDLSSETEAMKIINKITEARLKEGELANSGLDEEELEKIKTAFLNQWRSQNHERVQYPDSDKPKAKA